MCPSPPVTPEAYDKTKDSVSLKWKLPRHDGKGRIFGYLVEYKKPGAVEWTQANESPEQCPSLDYVVTGLSDGQEYVFRIFTVNAAGKSDPAYIKEPIKVHDRLGMCLIYFLGDSIRVNRLSQCFIIFGFYVNMKIFLPVGVGFKIDYLNCKSVTLSCFV